MRGHDDDDDDDDDDDALSLCGYLRLNCKFVWVVSAIKKNERHPTPATTGN